MGSLEMSVVLGWLRGLQMFGALPMKTLRALETLICSKTSRGLEIGGI